MGSWGWSLKTTIFMSKWSDARIDDTARCCAPYTYFEFRRILFKSVSYNSWIYLSRIWKNKKVTHSYMWIRRVFFELKNSSIMRWKTDYYAKLCDEKFYYPKFCAVKIKSSWRHKIYFLTPKNICFTIFRLKNRRKEHFTHMYQCIAEIYETTK